MTTRRWQARVRELVRQFQENGTKMLLEHPANVRDLLSLLHAPWLDEIDFGRMRQIKTTFIRRDYRHLEAMPAAERQRWRELLDYVGALVYHDRNESEHAELQEALERSMQNEELRQEVIEMGRSMADVLIERGEQKGEQRAAVRTRQQTLVRQLRKRFGNVPRGVVRAVEATTDVERLDDWLDRLVVAGTLDELNIPAAR